MQQRFNEIMMFTDSPTYDQPMAKELISAGFYHFTFPISGLHGPHGNVVEHVKSIFEEFLISENHRSPFFLEYTAQTSELTCVFGNEKQMKSARSLLS